MQSFIKTSSLFVLASIAAVTAGAACGGKVLFEPTGSSSGGAGGASSTHGSTSSKSSTVGNTSVGVTDGVTVGNTTNGVTTGVGGSAAVVTTGVGPSSVAATSTGTGSNVTVPCNGMQCNAGEICCFNPNGPGDHCGTSGMCDAGYVELSCNSPSDCPGQVCCADFDPNQQVYQGISCQATCNGMDQITLCSNMMPNVCPPGTQCHQSMQLGQGYRVCF
jgi:hypothetical protein